MTVILTNYWFYFVLNDNDYDFILSNNSMITRFLFIYSDVCLYVNFFFKHLLLLKNLSDFDEISQKCSCYGPLQNFLKEFDSVKNWFPWQQN